MSGKHKSLQEFMADENENFGGYRIKGQSVSREDYAAAYNGEYDKLSPEALNILGFDQDEIAALLGEGITRRGGNY